MGAILRAADEAEVGQRVRRTNYFGVFMHQRRGEIVQAQAEAGFAIRYVVDTPRPHQA